ncbi:MAG: polysaccharide deacetylase family protein, partial [Gemmatimonadaceae bacterium]|nr:polysaccharide deacetylase family protein [Gemmatimonadaceae bacterium]
MMQGARLGSLSADAVAVTFDDGYFDNLEFAAPALHESDVPATVFVSSGFIESDREMWWDQLDKVLLSGEPSSWNVTMPATTVSQKEYVQRCGELKFASPEGRRATLDRLVGDAGSRPTHRALTKRELSALAADGLVDIGGHTVNHVALSRMPLEIQRT